MSDLTRLFVGNVAYNVTEVMLTEELARLGVVAENVKIARDKETRGPKGFAFVEVAANDVDRAIKVANGAEIGGRALRVERSARQPADDLSRRRAGAPSLRPSLPAPERAHDGDVWRDEMRSGNSKRRSGRR